MTHTKPITLPAALNWVTGEIARLEEHRDALYNARQAAYDDVTTYDQDIDAAEQLLAELENLRTRC